MKYNAIRLAREGVMRANDQYVFSPDEGKLWMLTYIGHDEEDKNLVKLIFERGNAMLTRYYPLQSVEYLENLRVDDIE